MIARWMRGRYVWGVVGLAAVAVIAASATLAKPGDKNKGYLGVYMQKLTRDVREGLELDVKNGVLISGVEEDSPADKAGLEDGDVVVEFDGDAVRSPDDLRDMVRDTKPGTEVDVVVVRDGDRKTIRMEVGEVPDTWTFRGDWDDGHGQWGWVGDDGRNTFAMFLGGPKLGVTAAELNDDLASYFDTKAGEGILVLEVSDESVASEAGIKPGDVIVKVDKAEIADVDDLRESISGFEEGDEFEVSIIRKGRKQTLSATMNDQSNKFVWSGTGDRVHRRLRDIHVPEIRIDRGEIDERLDELREEIKELKQEIKKLKDDR